ncbi:hypothetical protein M569_11528, partial [Genlisea aurea]
HVMGTLGFGSCWYILGSSPESVPDLYCVLLAILVPLRWIYYRYMKWHYYLLDFCYYANTIFLVVLRLYPGNEKLFMVCFSFAEGPLAWALIVWRNGFVFHSADKLISIFIHLFPGIVFMTIRWRNAEPWPRIESFSLLWTWLLFVPMLLYCIWQLLYLLVVDVLRREMMLKDPEVLTSYRELSQKARKANNVWWYLNGLLGERNRLFTYILLQAVFTVATMAATLPIFLSYRLHIAFQLFKVSATLWNGAHFLLEVIPRKAILKTEKNK